MVETGALAGDRGSYRLARPMTEVRGYASSKAMVLGAGGFIGRQVTSALASAGAEVVAVARSADPHEKEMGFAARV